MTVGVEEEFLLLDPRTGGNVPVAGRVRAGLPIPLHGRSRTEVRRSVLEMVTGTCTDLRELRDQLVKQRSAAGDAAAEVGARLVAVGATPVAEADPTVVSRSRYETMLRQYGRIALDPAVCGLHVHVGVPDRELAVQVCNHLQVWLPVIRALAANSPLCEGQDTGHASWRSVQLLRWPSSGPAPHFDSAGAYDRLVAEMVTAGGVLDEAMIQWYARLSPAYPTVEVRVGDVCTDPHDAVLITALTRAAVATAVSDVEAGREPVPSPACVVAGAHWRAARYGLTGDLMDLRLSRLRPAWELVDEFFATFSPALLAAGDLDLVIAGLARLRDRGDGASRQRALFRRTGDVGAVVEMLAERTTGG